MARSVRYRSSSRLNSVPSHLRHRTLNLGRRLSGISSRGRRPSKSTGGHLRRGEELTPRLHRPTLLCQDLQREVLTRVLNPNAMSTAPRVFFSTWRARTVADAFDNGRSKMVVGTPIGALDLWVHRAMPSILILHGTRLHSTCPFATGSCESP